MDDDKLQHIQSLIQAARQAKQRGEHQKAAQLAVDAIELDDKCVPAYLLIARIQLLHDNYEPAEWAISEAIKLAPGEAAFRIIYANILAARGDFDDALNEAETAVGLAPDMGRATALKIHLLTMLTRYDEAAALLESALARWPDDVDVGLAFADLAGRLGRESEAAARLELHLPVTQSDPGQRADVLFRLASLYDRTGEADRAFAAAREANALRNKPWDPDTFDRSIANISSRWSREFIQSAPRATNDSKRVVLIVGMPRSGTSLVEQIIDCHPKAAGAGELPALLEMAYASYNRPGEQVLPFESDTSMLTAGEIDRIGREYMAGIAAISNDARIVTDKLPQNTAVLGLAQLALPDAHVIYCRRDPRDVCLSCYFTDFRVGNLFAWNLEHLGRYHLGQDRLMAHWQQVLDLPILSVDYERMVTHTEDVARGIIDFIGLDWDDRCLRFHESARVVRTASSMQVRRPVYRTSVGRHERYRRHLGGLYATLGLN